MMTLPDHHHVEMGPPWAVAIFAARESAATLEDTVSAAARAAAGRACRIDVLVNGNPELARELASRLQNGSSSFQTGLHIRVWFLEVGDKAQTWNTYVYRLYPGSELTFFVDGYARLEANALRELSLGLQGDQQALAASGVPSCGASARRHASAMLREGGIHGSLFVLPKQTMNEIRRRKFRLPMGLYRTDSLIGAVLNFGFDPAANAWNPTRIRVQANATWQYTPLRWWRLNDLKTHWKRRGRQLQGVLENLAISDYLVHRQKAPGSLPSTARDLVLQWWRGENGPKWHQILRHPSRLLALRRFYAAQDWSKADAAPRLVYRSPDQPLPAKPAAPASQTFDSMLV